MATRRFPLPIRLSTLPAAAALAVAVLAGLTLIDLARGHRQDEEDLKAAKESFMAAPSDTKRVPLTEDVPALSEDEAEAILKDRPTVAAANRLWPIPTRRGALFDVLVAKTSPEEVRLHLLAGFEEAEAAKALQAARSIVAEEEQREGPLLFSAYEIVSRLGEAKDERLFAERPGESNQAKSMREEYRNALRDRTGPK
jgi:hypothetical protein